MNEEGHAQAAKAAVGYAPALGRVRTICCSPLVRAQETAGYFARELNVPLVTVPELKEQLLGVWEKKPWQDVPEFFTGSPPPEGETLEQLDARVQKGLHTALQSEGPVLIVSHGAVWYALHRILSLQSEQPGSCVVFHFQKSPDESRWKRSGAWII